MHGKVECPVCNMVGGERCIAVVKGAVCPLQLEWVVGRHTNKGRKTTSKEVKFIEHGAKSKHQGR